MRFSYISYIPYISWINHYQFNEVSVGISRYSVQRYIIINLTLSVKYRTEENKTKRESWKEGKRVDMCIESKPRGKGRGMREYKEFGWRTPLWRQGGVIRVKPGSPWFPWIPGGYLQRGSTARTGRNGRTRTGGKNGEAWPATARVSSDASPHLSVRI